MQLHGGCKLLNEQWLWLFHFKKPIRNWIKDYITKLSILQDVPFSYGHKKNCTPPGGKKLRSALIKCLCIVLLHAPLKIKLRSSYFVRVKLFRVSRIQFTFVVHSSVVVDLPVTCPLPTLWTFNLIFFIDLVTMLKTCRWKQKKSKD